MATMGVRNGVYWSQKTILEEGQVFTTLTLQKSSKNCSKRSVAPSQISTQRYSSRIILEIMKKLKNSTALMHSMLTVLQRHLFDITPKRHNQSIRPKYVPIFINVNLIVCTQWSGNESVTPARPPDGHHFFPLTTIPESNSCLG